MFNWSRIKQIFCFSFWGLFNTVGDLCRTQGTAFIINGHFSANVNAAYSIANQVATQTSSLSNALQSAIMPAVVTAEGSANRKSAISLANRSCKFTTLLMVLFSVPAIFEMDYLLSLWLDVPPAYTKGLCVCILISLLINKMTEGFHMAIVAAGDISLYQIVTGLTYIMTLPLILALMYINCGAMSVGYAFMVIFTIISIERVVFGKILVGIGVNNWIKTVVIPLSVLTLILISVGCLPMSLIQKSFYRVLITGSISMIAGLVTSWFFVLDQAERNYIVHSGKILRFLQRNKK